MSRKATQSNSLISNGLKKGVGIHIHRPDLEVLEARLGYTFQDRGLLERALTHRSFANETEEILEDNQRLEFLGDAVLGLVTAHELFRRDESAPEGALSNRQSQLVCESTLANLAETLEVGTFLRLGRGETLTGGRHKSGLLADAMEAIFAAIYLDAGSQGLIAGQTVILHLLEGALDALTVEDEAGVQATDHKSVLQRRAQNELAERPIYEIIEEFGPPHDRVFIAQVRVDSRILGRGEGSSKKRAEQEAASRALVLLDEALDETGRSEIFDGVS
ncbi:MAG: ribonuclease III [Bradymonadaceae bacterium]